MNLSVAPTHARLCVSKRNGLFLRPSVIARFPLLRGTHHPCSPSSSPLRARAALDDEAAPDDEAASSSSVDPALLALRGSSGALKGLSDAAFWSQLALTLVSAGVLIFSTLISSAGGVKGLALDVSKGFSCVGLALCFISTFFAFRLQRLARKLATGQDSGVDARGLVGKLLGSTAINIWGIGFTTIGLQASVGTLVGKTFLQAAQAPFQYNSGGAALVSLDVFALQASTNILLCHLLGLIFINLTLRVVNAALPKIA